MHGICTCTSQFLKAAVEQVSQCEGYSSHIINTPGIGWPTNITSTANLPIVETWELFSA